MVTIFAVVELVGTANTVPTYPAIGRAVAVVGGFKARIGEQIGLLCGNCGYRYCWYGQNNSQTQD